MAAEKTVMQKIIDTHSSDNQDVDVTPFLFFIDDILLGLGIPDLRQGTQPQLKAMDDYGLTYFEEPKVQMFAQTITKLSCQMCCNCCGSQDEETKTESVFNILTRYSWIAKLVLALAAFAVNYGEFWMVAPLNHINPFVEAVSFLKNLSGIKQCADLEPDFELIGKLINAMLDLTKCIVKFQELPPEYITPDTWELKAANLHIPDAVYWTIRSMVTYGTQIVGLIGNGHANIRSTIKTSELLKLTETISNKHSLLKNQLILCHQHIDNQIFTEKYTSLVRLFEVLHVDNQKILKSLIYSKDDILPLFDGNDKKRVRIDVLRRKHLLLLISDLDFSREELSVLVYMYEERRQNPTRIESQYEIMWLPVTDKSIQWGDKQQKQFEGLQAMMPWYSPYHPILHAGVIKYIEEVWHFKKKPLLVVLGPHGKVVNPNAINMFYIWESHAFPFTSSREQELWKNEIWRIEFLLNSIEPQISTWVKEGKYICLYGGKHMEWIREFTTTAKKVAKSAQIPLEMLYIGKSNPNETIQENIDTIAAEKLTHTLRDLTQIHFFWLRLESMYHSKTQIGNILEKDQIMQESVTLLSYDRSHQGVVLISKNSTEIIKARGDLMLERLSAFNSWKEEVTKKEFKAALKDYFNESHKPSSSSEYRGLILPGTAGSASDTVVCAKCFCPMEQVFIYKHM